MQRFHGLVFTMVLVGSVLLAAQSTPSSTAEIDALYPDLETLYRDLHRNPELGFQELQTASKLSARLKSLGYEVTTGVGGTGIVALLKNSAGPVAMLRTELDALPVAEKTGAPFASTVTAKNAAGLTVPVMHACGHDLHMSAWVGTAKWMADHRQLWRGTLMLVAQPAEETGGGATAMLTDGLFHRFPRIARAEAMAAGAPREPIVQLGGTVNAVYNDPALTGRIAAALQIAMGQQVVEMPAKMTSEDFSEYGRAGVPSLLVHVGAVNPAKLAEARRTGVPVPAPHSPEWLPDLEPTLKAGVLAETTALVNLLQGQTGK
jgi:metal-dependent amidase/aminoacylase/carboxypeptidase family protein